MRTLTLYASVFFLQILIFPLSAPAKISIDNPGATDNTFFSAKFIDYNAEEDFIYAEQTVQIRSDRYLLTCDRILYDIQKDLIWAEGDVRILESNGKTIYGRTVFLQDKLKYGVISDLAIRFSDNVLLAARLAKRLQDGSQVLSRTCFSPCKINKHGKTLWSISLRKSL
jgi:LPS-assembly protein